MPDNVKDFDINETIEDETFITIEGQSFGVVQTTPPKDLLIKVSKLRLIHEDLDNCLKREKALREKNIRILSSLEKTDISNEEIDKILAESYETEEKIKTEAGKQNDIFAGIFSLAYELIKWSLGEKIFEKIKDDIEKMGSIELANKAYEAVSKNKTLMKYMNQNIKAD